MCSGKCSRLLLPLTLAFLHTGLLLKALSRQKTHEKQNKVMEKTKKKNISKAKVFLEILAFLMSMLCSVLNPSSVILVLF